MSRRSADPRLYEFDSALRSALHMAVDSVEPGAEGLDQIRAKIAAKQSARRRLGWRSATPGADGSWWRSFLPPRGWLPAVVGAVVERFRPDPNRAGWFGWLRPAAAVTTGLFVVTAASWAVAALPSAINPSGSSTTVSTSSPTHHRHHTSISVPYSSNQGLGTQSGRGGTRPSSTPSCTTPGGSQGGTTSGGPSQTTSPSVSPSTSTSTSSTSSAQTTPPSSPSIGGASPASSAGFGADPAPSSSPEATGKALLVAGPDIASAEPGADPSVPTETPAPTGSPTVGSGSPTPTSSAQPSSTPCGGA